jgi:hypothetical protein
VLGDFQTNGKLELLLKLNRIAQVNGDEHVSGNKQLSRIDMIPIQTKSSLDAICTKFRQPRAGATANVNDTLGAED